jgi:hypothetical protein
MRKHLTACVDVCRPINQDMGLKNQRSQAYTKISYATYDMPIPVTLFCSRCLAGIVESNPATRSVSWRCCVLSGRGLCDGPITRPEESYRPWRVCLFVSRGVRVKPRMYYSLLAYCTARFGSSNFGHQMPPRLPTRSAL